MSDHQIHGGGGLLKHIDVDAESTDCVISGVKVCTLETDVKKMREFLSNIGKSVKESPVDVINEMKKTLGVDSEADIWEHPQFKKWIGTGKAEKVLFERFKPVGPGDSTDLLDNNNIDDTLEKWAINGNKLYKNTFYHIPFQMIDFASKGTELANLDIARLMKDGYDCFGVVLNTDVSTGRGKHWFCIFGDLKHKGTSEDPIRIEYFNSSGNPPMMEVDVWLEKTKHDLIKDFNIYTEIVRSVPKRLQNSQTECGIWSLLYIKSRLENKPTDWFYKVNADDDDMIEYRKLLFRSK